MVRNNNQSLLKNGGKGGDVAPKNSEDMLTPIINETDIMAGSAASRNRYYHVIE